MRTTYEDMTMYHKRILMTLSGLIAASFMLGSTSAFAAANYEESVECAAFYSITGVAAEQTGDTEILNLASEAAGLFMINAQTVSSNNEETITNDIIARGELMANEIDNDISNLIVLVNKYNDRCIALM